MQNVVISNPSEFEQKKERLKQGGTGKLHVVSDFDKTLTTAFEHGAKRRSLVELIRKHQYLPPAYVERAYELFNKYHPIEVDHQVSTAVKKEKMQEWWSTHVQLMRDMGMCRETVEKIIREQSLNARPGMSTFLDTLRVHNIPVLILSASVTDLVEGFLNKEHLLFPNMHVVSNKYVYDSDGRVLGYEDKIVHSLNKDEAVVRGTPYESLVMERKNVLLLGDGMDDVGMLNGFSHDTVIKIGFLNDDVENKLLAYKEVYDVVILNDGSMDFVNELLKEILSEK